MKRRGFLATVFGGALVAAQEAFVGDAEPSDTFEVTLKAEPLEDWRIYDKGLPSTEFPPVKRTLLTKDGRTYQGKLTSWSAQTQQVYDKQQSREVMDVTVKYRYEETKGGIHE